MEALTKKAFEQHPATDDPIRAVVVKITEPKLKTTKFGDKWKFAIVFETEMKNDEGQPWVFWSHGYTAVKNGEKFAAIMDEKSNLYKDAIKIMGGKIPDGFNTNMLLGIPVKMVIEHKHTDDAVYANMTYLGSYKGDSPYVATGDYTEKEKSTNTGSNYQKAEGTPETKEDWKKTKVHVGQFAGHQLESIDTEALQKLITNWLPKAKAAEKPTADDKRLIHALEEANKVINPKDDF